MTPRTIIKGSQIAPCANAGFGATRATHRPAWAHHRPWPQQALARLLGPV
jgi:hypothetical protein